MINKIVDFINMYFTVMVIILFVIVLVTTIIQIITFLTNTGA